MGKVKQPTVDDVWNRYYDPETQRTDWLGIITDFVEEAHGQSKEEVWALAQQYGIGFTQR